MSDSCTFDANRRLAEIALWLDGGARWIDRATGQALSHGGQGEIAVTFNRSELEAFVFGLRGVSRTMLGLAQPVPTAMASARGHLRLVKE